MNTDPAFHLLTEPLNDSDGRLLWFVDDNISLAMMQAIRPRSHLVVLTNRYDHYQQLLAQGFNTTLSDFDGNAFADNGFDRIFYRISKEKAIVHYIINQAARLLKQNGRLLLSGYKNEGIKTYTKKAAEYLGCIAEKKRGKYNASLATLTKDQVATTPLDDQQYPTLRTINTTGQYIWQSKPGIFGWQKIDQGSALLIQQLEQWLKQNKQQPSTVLDLGCGYGYLGTLAGSLTGATVTAVDNNIAAVSACTANFTRYLQPHDIDYRVICDDCGSTLSGHFDLIVCNPPFHQGFTIDSDLTNKFLTASKRLLAKNGHALLVVNRFIPLERKAEKLFNCINLLADNGQFKVAIFSDPVTN